MEIYRLLTISWQPALRQTVYLVIKELSDTAEDVIMVTSSLMKDMQSNADAIYRPNAIRALCRIIDVRMRISIQYFISLIFHIAAFHGPKRREILQSCDR